ncbi:MAG TPA: hypothetical protein VG274_11355, partial [Rhizomicrobium sp.]|nr:hypothetical protein [Rhizomicrobium sp.]
MRGHDNHRHVDPRLARAFQNRLLNRVMGANQSWNYAGNIAAALAGMVLVSALGLESVFYSVGACALLAAVSVVLIRERDLDERVATGRTHEENAERSGRTCCAIAYFSSS